MLYECSTTRFTEKGKLVEMTGSYWIVGWVCISYTQYMDDCVCTMCGRVEVGGLYALVVLFECNWLQQTVVLLYIICDVSYCTHVYMYLYCGVCVHT